ncbi:hypothetical protein HDV03_003272 [Kappamyces sp. JEL0829]|nr:hypothetical protein HDV03_003272 [Kappamyces sp. JEL0829]
MNQPSADPSLRQYDEIIAKAKQLKFLSTKGPLGKGSVSQGAVPDSVDGNAAIVQTFKDSSSYFLLILSDFIVGNPVKSAAERLEELAWNQIFYPLFQHLKKTKSAKQLLISELQTATGYYQDLVLQLQTRYHVNYATSVQKREADRIIYKTLIFLGDIARYRSPLMSAAPTFSEAWKWYESAIQINPRGGTRRDLIAGKPHSQLAILSSYKGESMDVLYYNHLSLGNLESSSNAKSNLGTFLTNYMQNSPAQHTILGQFMSFLALLLDDDGLSSSLMAVCFAYSSIFDEPVSQLPGNGSVCSKQSLCFLVLYQDMNTMFAKTTNTAVKQNIRNRQVLVLHSLFSISAYCMGRIAEQLEAADQTTVDESSHEVWSDELVTASRFCLWFSMSYAQSLASYVSYGKLLDTKAFDAKMFAWARSLARLGNLLSSFADMDKEGGTERCISDKDILALSCFGDIAKHDQSKKQRDLFFRPLVHYSRMGSFISALAEDAEIDFFTLNKEDGSFVVLDGEAKRKNMQRVMKALAAERLKSQVAALETKLGSFMHLDHPVYLPDTNCFLFSLPLVKSWLMTRSCTIVVSVEVIRSLDIVKKSGHAYSNQAREAIRYLEQRFKYTSPYLVGQKSEEAICPWAADGSLENGGYVPYTYQTLSAPV